VKVARIRILNTNLVGIVEHSVILEGIPENCRVYCFVFGSSDADEKTKKTWKLWERSMGITFS
jgi:hypothetical protein